MVGRKGLAAEGKSTAKAHRKVKVKSKVKGVGWGWHISILSPYSGRRYRNPPSADSAP